MFFFCLRLRDYVIVHRVSYSLLFCFLFCVLPNEQATAQCNQLEIPNNGIDEDCDQLDGIFLQLPPVIYMVEGQDFELYFRNCILSTHPLDYQFAVNTPLYGQKSYEKWSFTPSGSQVGAYPLTLQVLNYSGQVLESKTCTVRISAAAAPSDMRTRSVMLWGHSFFDQGYLPIYISEFTSQQGKNPPMQWIGKTPNWLGGPTRYEAKGGTTWAYYLDQYSSPFSYNGQLNLRRYFDEQQCYNCAPDLIIAYLDINDYVYSAQLDVSSIASIDAAIDAVYQQKVVPMLAAMKAAAPNAKIAYCMAPAASGHDNAFFASLGSSVLGNRYRWEKIVNRLLYKTREQLANREAEGIYLVPTGLDLDVWNEYSETDALHPHVANGQLAPRSGYREIGKSIYAWMKYAMGPSTSVPPTALPCSITAQASQIMCQSHDVTQIDDDTYTFDLSVQGQSVSALWNTNLAGQSFFGTYAGTKTFGPFLIKNGQIAVELQDSENPNCKTTVQVAPPKPCSIVLAPNSSYCISAVQSPWQAWLSSVRVGTFEHTSTKAQYNDFTHQPIPITTQLVIPVALTTTYSYESYNEFYCIWVDINRNGIFEEPAETMLKGFLYKNQNGLHVSNTLFSQIQLPRGIGSGYARMRVSMKQDGYPTPCEAYDRGETEDYLLQINDQIEGVTPREAVAKLDISPNPSSGVFELNLRENITKGGQINVQNLLGQTVLQTESNQNQITIDLSGQPEGAYLLRLEMPNERPVFYWLAKQ
jgi:GEVED domain/Secretion system C-terminal sorting domain